MLDDVLILQLTAKATEVLKKEKVIEPQEFRKTLGLGSDATSLKIFREVMSTLIRTKSAKWNPSSLCWEFVQDSE
jgi:hypothetical protein